MTFSSILRKIILAVPVLAVTSALAQSNVAETPPMGWNSYDCFGYAVNESEVLQNADFIDKNLKKLGWQYVVIDYVWSCPRLQPDFALNQDANFKPRLAMDSYGRLIPDPVRFPSSIGGLGFKPLADSLHKRGLKFGIHLMRGIPRQAVADNTPIFGSPFHAQDAYTTTRPCGWLNHMWGFDMTRPAAQDYLNSMFKLYASWGVDFVKVDDISNPYSEAEIEGYQNAIRNSGRPIVLSLSPGPTPLDESAVVSQHANMWRLLGDLWDAWGPLKAAFLSISNWSSIRVPGHWPDPDMLPLGRLRKYGPNTGPPDTDSRLTKDEARTMMTLWCIARCPLMFGGNLPDTDPYTISLISNPEVLAVNQRSTDNQPVANGLKPIWLASSNDPKVKYLALFNRTDSEAVVNLRLSDIAIKNCKVRDLWLRKDLGAAIDYLRADLPAHGSMLYRLSIVEPADLTDSGLLGVDMVGISYEAESPDNTLSGDVRVVDDVSDGKCSGQKFVRFIGSKPQNTLQFNKVMADKDGDFTLTIVYMSGTDRKMGVSVNGEPLKIVSFTETGGWDGRYLDVQEVPVHLKQGANTILFANPTDWGVDVDRILVRPGK